MHIHLTSSHMGAPSDSVQNSLTKLLAQHPVQLGFIRRVAAASVFLQFHQTKLKLPLNSFSEEQRAALVEGRPVELIKRDQSLILRVLSLSKTVDSKGHHVALKQLEQVLVELNIPPTAETVLVAQALLERGFPLQETLIWSLLPWAERGQLSEAFQLLQAKFPLKPELVEMVQSFQTRNVREALGFQIAKDLPLDLQKLLKYPSWESRGMWSDRFSDGELFKALVRLLVEERFVEALFNQQGNSQEFVFALPFSRAEDLYVSWVRITRDDNSQRQDDGEDDDKREECLRLRINVPTASLGLVGAEMRVQGKNVSITLNVEEESTGLIWQSMESLEQELTNSGWNLTETRVRGWENAKGCGFTL